MAAHKIGVLIDHGEIPSARGVAEGHELAMVIGRWQGVAHGSFRDDCRFLKQMIEETDELRLWEKNVGGFRYPDRDRFLREQVLIDYDLTEQDMVEIVAMLKQDDVKAAQAKLATHGGDRKSAAAKDQVGDTKLIGNTRPYIIGRLERDGHTELAAKVRNHKMSARAAAIKVGIREKPTPLSTLRRAWAKATSDERRTFLAEVRK